jgi:hypothetical protein
MFTDDSFVNVSLAFMGRLSSVSPRVLSCDLNKPAGTNLRAFLGVSGTTLKRTRKDGVDAR